MKDDVGVTIGAPVESAVGRVSRVPLPFKQAAPMQKVANRASPHLVLVLWVDWVALLRYAYLVAPKIVRSILLRPSSSTAPSLSSSAQSDPAADRYPVAAVR